MCFGESVQPSPITTCSIVAKGTYAEAKKVPSGRIESVHFMEWRIFPVT